MINLEQLMCDGWGWRGGGAGDVTCTVNEETSVLVLLSRPLWKVLSWPRRPFFLFFLFGLVSVLDWLRWGFLLYQDWARFTLRCQIMKKGGL